MYRQPEIYHIAPRRSLEAGEALTRCEKAWESWSFLYECGGVIPRHVWETKRDATSIGSDRDLPFLKDVLQIGMEECSSNSILLFTNDDVILHPMLVGEIKRHIALFESGSIRRSDIVTKPFKGHKDFVTKMPPLSAPPYEFVSAGLPHLGRDGFIFTVDWLRSNWSRIPDFLLGAWGWDVAVALLIRALKGHENKSLQSLYDNFYGCELPDGLVIHEYHDSYWHIGEDWANLPYNKYNRRLFEAWVKDYAPKLDPKLVDNHRWPNGALIRSVKYWNHVVECSIPQGIENIPYEV